MTRLLPLVLACIPLSACSTLGGTVRGDFSCRAVTGSCAPLSVNDAAAVEAGGTLQPKRSGRQHRVDGLASRTGERLLTIVLPAYVDQDGTLHDPATVHVVSEPARWDSAHPATLTDILPFSRGPALSPREITGGASVSLVEEPEPSPARAPQPSTRPRQAALEAARAGHRIATPSVIGSSTAGGASSSDQPVVRPLGQAPLTPPAEGAVSRPSAPSKTAKGDRP